MKKFFIYILPIFIYTSCSLFKVYAGHVTYQDTQRSIDVHADTLEVRGIDKSEKPTTKFEKVDL